LNTKPSTCPANCLHSTKWSCTCTPSIGLAAALTVRLAGLFEMPRAASACSHACSWRSPNPWSPIQECAKALGATCSASPSLHSWASAGTGDSHSLSDMSGEMSGSSSQSAAGPGMRAWPIRTAAMGLQMALIQMTSHKHAHRGRSLVFNGHARLGAAPTLHPLPVSPISCEA
jgi:hypothetical protein